MYKSLLILSALLCLVHFTEGKRVKWIKRKKLPKGLVDLPNIKSTDDNYTAVVNTTTRRSRVLYATLEVGEKALVKNRYYPNTYPYWISTWYVLTVPTGYRVTLTARSNIYIYDGGNECRLVKKNSG